MLMCPYCGWQTVQAPSSVFDHERNECGINCDQCGRFYSDEQGAEKLAEYLSEDTSDEEEEGL